MRYINEKNSTFIISLLFFVSLMIAFSWGLISGKNKTFPYSLALKLYGDKTETDDYKKDLYKTWAKKVVEGGYILHFRHAEREKWVESVTAFDAYELINRLDAEKESFRKATCLTDKGIEEAKLIGHIFDMLDIKVGEIYTSPSCRSRMTSRYAFGSEGTIVNAILHRTAIIPSQHEEAAYKLKDILMNAKIEENSNVIISGHGGTLSYDKDILFTGEVPDNIDERAEGGFVVIERKDGQLFVRCVYPSIKEFANNILSLDLS